MADEALYSQVADELQKNGPIPGLWAKAFAECDGHDAKSKARYLRLRVEQLMQKRDLERQAEIDAVESAERGRFKREQEAKTAAQKLLAAEFQRANAALPWFQRKMPDDTARFVIALLIILLVGAMCFAVAIAGKR